MARFTEPPEERDRVDALIERWKAECLLRDGSLLYDDRTIWTEAHVLDFRRRYLNDARDSDASFEERLKEQLGDASDDVRFLAAEILVIHVVFAQRIISPPRKVQFVESALGPLQGERAPHWDEVVAALGQGVAHPGTGFNAARGLHVEYLLDFVLRWKRLPPDEQHRLLDDPWRLRDFADDTERRLRREMRHIVLHLLRPDEYERISSGTHKRKIAEEFGAEAQAAGTELPEDLDERVFAIRRYLEPVTEQPGLPVLDFYFSPLSERWLDITRYTHGYEPDKPEDTEPAAERWWWVNQNKTYAAEREGQILWAPLRDKAGNPKHHWDTMDEVEVGDRIVHYRGQQIVAVSVVSETAGPARKPPELGSDEWATDGRLVRSHYTDLQRPLSLGAIPERYRRAEGGPFNQLGGVNQGYLFPLSDSFVPQLLALSEELSTFGAPGATAKQVNLADVAAVFREAIDQSGLVVPQEHDDRVLAVMAALATKPFVILSGLSGSGKTQLALRLGEWFGSSTQGRRFLPVAVRPDWTGPEALFGYEDALREVKDGRAAWFVPDTLKFMLRARRDPGLPYLLLLDEMNLAHVERYFSDFLSGIESREPVLPNLEPDAGGVWRPATDGPEKVKLPANLFIVGTVNVDETTYLFSPKVLDRAFTFEIRTGTDELGPSRERPRPIEPGPEALLKALVEAANDDHWHVRTPSAHQDQIVAALRRLHSALTKSGDEFGHRVFYESLRLAAAFDRMGAGSLSRALDYILLLKIVPRIHGSRRRAEPVLQRLQRFAHDIEADLEGPVDPALTSDPVLPLSAAKIDRMLHAVRVNQFVSFSE